MPPLPPKSVVCMFLRCSRFVFSVDVADSYSQISATIFGETESWSFLLFTVCWDITLAMVEADVSLPAVYY